MSGDGPAARVAWISSSSGAVAAQQCDLPVGLVNVTGGTPGRSDVHQATVAASPTLSRPADWADLVVERDPQDSDIRVTKQTRGAFQDTPLAERLTGLGVTQVVLAKLTDTHQPATESETPMADSTGRRNAR